MRTMATFLIYYSLYLCIFTHRWKPQTTMWFVKIMPKNNFKKTSLCYSHTLFLSSHPVKQGSLLTPQPSGPCSHLQRLCFFLPVSQIFTSNIPASSTIGLHQFLLSSRTKKVASEPRGPACAGHWEEGGGACLLAMRVSRSVRLRVCEAVIRFQDFPSVTGLLTKPYTPLHEETPPHLNPPSPKPSGCYTSAAPVTCSHTPNTKY